VSRYRQQISAAIEAVTIRGPARYAWLGRASRPLRGAVESAMDERALEAYLVASLSHELYSSFYCRGEPVPARWGEPEPIAPDPALTAELSDANAGAGSWDGGWTVERVEDGHAVLTSDVRVRVPVRDCRAPDGVHPGAGVEIRAPKEHVWLAPGFYTALSDTVVGAGSSVLRVYWHITATGAPALMRALTTRFNASRTPFRLKVADHPARFDRCDAAVLYLPDARPEDAHATLLAVTAELGPHLRRAVPAFTLELAPGVGVAEHDGGPSSFGTSRCRLLAEAIVRGHALGVATVDERIGVVEERFARAGIAIDAPYRDPSLAGRHVL
jgi:class II lanthipeptide synthase